jgi:hypothetical protein
MLDRHLLLQNSLSAEVIHQTTHLVAWKRLAKIHKRQYVYTPHPDDVEIVDD